MKQLLIHVILFGISAYVQATIKCTTPDGMMGRCVHLNLCKPLRDLYKKPYWHLTVRDNLLLTYSNCLDRINPRNKDKVCCPHQPPKLVTVNPLLCHAFDGQVGLCTNLQLCPTLNDTLEQPVTARAIEALDNSRCGNLERYSVCCSLSPPIGHQPVSFHSYMEEDKHTPHTTCTLSSIPPHPQSNCCGIHSTNGDRIIGGTATSIDEYPWLVLIEYRTIGTNTIKIGCGGSLISGRYVLTAGHCLVGSSIDGLIPANIRLGEYNLLNPGPDCILTPGGGEDCTEGPLVIPIEQIIIHEQYDPKDVHGHNDIALIRLSKTAPYSDFIRPICLPTSDLSKHAWEGLRLFASGWGMTGTLEILTSVKREVDLPYWRFDVSDAYNFASQSNAKECQEIYNEINIVLSQNNICAGGEPGKDACKGDSGGPLMYKNGELYELAGVVSFGPKLCGQDIPSVYTNVYSYLPWIWQHIKRY